MCGNSLVETLYFYGKLSWTVFMDGKNSISNLPRDLIAGVVVFLVALPLCLGVALASNAPLFSGLLSVVNQ